MWRCSIRKFASEVENVFAGVNSYLPFPSLVAFSGAALGAASGNDSNTRVLLHFDGADASTTMTDSNVGGAAHVWTAAGNAQIDTAQAQSGGASLLLDGTGDWVSTPDHADFAFGSGDFTIDCWFNCSDPIGTVRAIAGQCDSAASFASISFYIVRNIASAIQADNLHLALPSSTLCHVSAPSCSPIRSMPGWHHLALVRSGC